MGNARAADRQMERKGGRSSKGTQRRQIVKGNAKAADRQRSECESSGSSMVKSEQSALAYFYLYYVSSTIFLRLEMKRIAFRKHLDSE